MLSRIWEKELFILLVLFIIMLILLGAFCRVVRISSVWRVRRLMVINELLVASRLVNSLAPLLGFVYTLS